MQNHNTQLYCVRKCCSTCESVCRMLETCSKSGWLCTCSVTLVARYWLLIAFIKWHNHLYQDDMQGLFLCMHHTLWLYSMASQIVHYLILVYMLIHSCTCSSTHVCAYPLFHDQSFLICYRLSSTKQLSATRSLWAGGKGVLVPSSVKFSASKTHLIRQAVCSAPTLLRWLLAIVRARVALENP